MSNKRKRHTSEFKSKVALAALKGDRTIAELVKEFEVHESQIYQWKNQVLAHIQDVFKIGKKSASVNNEAEMSKLHEKIGQLLVERDFLKKVLGR